MKKTGGKYRECIVLELVSNEPLTKVELARLKESIEHGLEQSKRTLPSLDNFQVVSEDRFDTDLRKSLRLE